MSPPKEQRLHSIQLAPALLILLEYFKNKHRSGHKKEPGTFECLGGARQSWLSRLISQVASLLMVTTHLKMTTQGGENAEHLAKPLQVASGYRTILFEQQILAIVRVDCNPLINTEWSFGWEAHHIQMSHTENIQDNEQSPVSYKCSTCDSQAFAWNSKPENWPLFYCAGSGLV
eukprot:4341381-Amphidinium_carterae.1